MTDIKLLNRHSVAINGESEWCVRIVNEVVTIDGSLLTTLSPLIAHVVDRWTRYQHLKVVSGGIVSVVDHKDLIEHLTRNLTRHSHNHGVVGDQTWHQLSLLIVEEHLGDTTKVLTYNTDIVVHVSA